MANMNQFKSEYQNIVDQNTPKNNVWKNSISAFYGWNYLYYWSNFY